MLSRDLGEQTQFLHVVSQYDNSDIIDNILYAIKGDNVVNEDGSVLTNFEKLQSIYDGSPVAIVSLNVDADVDLDNLSADVLANSNYKTVIVVQGDSFAVASTQDASAITDIVGSYSNIGTSLVVGADNIFIASGATRIETTTSTTAPPAGGSDAPVLEIVGVIGLVLVIVTVFAMIDFDYISDRRAARKAKKDKKKVFKLVSDDEILSENFEKISEIYEQHVAMGSDKSALRIEKLMSNTLELLKRSKRMGAGQGELLKVKYADVLDKLVEVLGEDYYIDISNNKNLWSNPERRLRKVEEKLDEVNEDILNNIRRINANRDIDFRVALESLVDSRENGVSDVFDKYVEPDNSKVSWLNRKRGQAAK